jgi:transposase
MDWCRIYRTQGLAGLVDQRRGGNHAKLSRAQKDELGLKLNRYTPRDLWGSATHSPSGQFWTVEDLVRGVAQWYGIRYQSRMAYLLLLKYCGFTYQRTEKVYKSRRTAEVLAFGEALEKK